VNSKQDKETYEPIILSHLIPFSCIERNYYTTYTRERQVRTGG